MSVHHLSMKCLTWQYNSRSWVTIVICDGHVVFAWWRSRFVRALALVSLLLFIRRHQLFHVVNVERGRQARRNAHAGVARSELALHQRSLLLLLVLLGGPYQQDGLEQLEVFLSVSELFFVWIEITENVKDKRHVRHFVCLFVESSQDRVIEFM